MFVCNSYMFRLRKRRNYMLSILWTRSFRSAFCELDVAIAGWTIDIRDVIGGKVERRKCTYMPDLCQGLKIHLILKFAFWQKIWTKIFSIASNSLKIEHIIWEVITFQPEKISENEFHHHPIPLLNYLIRSGTIVWVVYLAMKKPEIRLLAELSHPWDIVLTPSRRAG